MDCFVAALLAMTGTPSSWPGIAVRRTASLSLAYARPSTSSFPHAPKDVGARHKAGHDAVVVHYQCRAELRLAGDGLAECCLRCGKAGDRHAIGRARNVIEPDFVAERDGSGIAAMLAANADLEIGPRLASACNADLDE